MKRREYSIAIIHGAASFGLMLLAVVSACTAECSASMGLYRTAIHPKTAYLAPSCAMWCVGLFFLTLGVAAAIVSHKRTTRVFFYCEALLGGIVLFQAARSYASFDEVISYRSPFSLGSVQTDYALLERVETQNICVSGQRRIYQIALQFRNGRVWRSAIDGMLDDERDIRRLLDVVRIRAPKADFVSKLLPKQVLIFFEHPDHC